ncbi:MAG: hypothetical protein QM729_13750 [Solirubrobacterales bacterium]
MRSRLLVLALPALLLVALLVSGCGGGGSESSTTTAKKKETTSRLSKAGFISQGDAICAEVNTAIGSVEQSASETSSQTTQIANLYIGMVQSLQRLGQPTEKDGYSEFMGAAEELAMVQNNIKKAADEEDLVAEEEAAGEAGSAVEEFQSQAAVYGFEDCSEGPHAPEVQSESSGESSEEPGEEAGGVEATPEEEGYVEEEYVPEEEEEGYVEEVAPEGETGGAGGEIEEAAPEEEEVPAETGGESGGVGPG